MSLFDTPVNRRRSIFVASACVLSWLGIQWGSVGFALDPHWTTSWVCLAFVIGGLWFRGRLDVVAEIRWLVGLSLIVGLFFLGNARSVESLVILAFSWTLLFSRIGCQREVEFWLRRLMFGLVLLVSSVLIALAASKGYHGEWNHSESYNMVLPWAHRNIAMESLVLLGFAVSSRRKALNSVSWIALGVLTFAYQARGAMLMVAVWGVLIMLGQLPANQGLKRLIQVGCAAMIVLQLGWFFVLPTVRVESFEMAPDVLKSLDIRYNVSQATSSSERRAIWSWTLNHLEWIGPGPGEWKWCAEMEVNQLLNKCDVAVRRAHSDLLQLFFELGVLPMLILLGLIREKLRLHWREVLVCLPMLLFSFALERAEVIASLCLMGVLIEGTRSDSSKHGEKHLFLPAGWVFLACGLSTGCWWVAQNSLGEATRGATKFAEWGLGRRECVDMFPSDVALNHVDVILSSYWYAQGSTDRAADMLSSHLKNHPKSISGLKAWHGMHSDRDFDCGELIDIFHERQNQ